MRYSLKKCELTYRLIFLSLSYSIGKSGFDSNSQNFTKSLDFRILRISSENIRKSKNLFKKHSVRQYFREKKESAF